jgi:hypothetical protein
MKQEKKTNEVESQIQRLVYTVLLPTETENNLLHFVIVDFVVGGCCSW